MEKNIVGSDLAVKSLKAIEKVVKKMFGESLFNRNEGLIAGSKQQCIDALTKLFEKEAR